MSAVRIAFLLLLLLGWQPVQADAGQRATVQSDHIRLGVVHDTSLNDYCGVNLQFSKDFRKNYGKYAFMIADMQEKKAVMHLDGRDVYLQLTSWTTKENADQRIISERLSLKNSDYRVEITWLVTDICDKKHNEDCEIEGLRAYISIYRNNKSSDNAPNKTSVRHVRLLGIKGC